MNDKIPLKKWEINFIEATIKNNSLDIKDQNNWKRIRDNLRNNPFYKSEKGDSSFVIPESED